MKYSITLTLLFFSLISSAIQIDWIGSVSTDWHDASNWSPNQVPTLLDDVKLVFPPGPSGTIDVFSGAALARSIKMEYANLNLSSSSTLQIDDHVPTYNVALLMTKSVVNCNGVTFIKGGIEVNGSHIQNTSDINISGIVDNTPISLLLTDGGSFTNTGSGQLFGFNNIEGGTGAHKDAFIFCGESSLFQNHGLVNYLYNIGIDDWAEKGIVINNGGVFVNYINGDVLLPQMRMMGIHIKNDLPITPYSKFVTYGDLIISECSSCNYEEDQCAIKTEQKSKYENLTSPPQSIIITGFDGINANKYCIHGQAVLVDFGNAVDLGGYIATVGAIAYGNGSFTFDEGTIFECTISPGNPYGPLDFHSTFTATENTNFLFEIKEDEADGEPTMKDKISFEPEGDITGSTLTVELKDSYIPAISEEFTIITGNYTGEFGTLDLPGGEAAWLVKYEPNGITLVVKKAIKNVFNVGIGTDTPHTALEISKGDLYLNSADLYIIMKNTEGECFKVYVDVNGNLVTDGIPCPN